MSGGEIGDRFTLMRASSSLPIVANISGGEFGDEFLVSSNNEVNFIGTEFSLDGVLLDDLSVGQPFTIFERDRLLAGVLADGTPFDVELNSLFEPDSDFFSFLSTLTVTLVPEPSASALLLLLAGAACAARRARRGAV